MERPQPHSVALIKLITITEMNNNHRNSNEYPSEIKEAEKKKLKEIRERND